MNVSRAFLEDILREMQSGISYDTMAEKHLRKILAKKTDPNERVIVSAANRWDDGLIIASPRHFDMTMHNICARVFPDKKYALCDQGFIDQRGVWMDREEAFFVAVNAGQLIDRTKSDPEHVLFSEDLY